MRHALAGMACENCGAIGPPPTEECPAEATLAELLAMRRGTAPLRCVLITPTQMVALAGQPAVDLSPVEIAELLPNETDPTLIGNRIEAAIKRLGIPPCGGCGTRRDWLNAAHAYLRELATGLAG